MPPDPVIVEPDPGVIAARLDDAMLADRARLSSRLRRINADQPRYQNTLDDIALTLTESIETRQQRAATVPTVIHYPEDLPVSQRRDDIRAAIIEHQVVVVCGETGSGKTTQLPKICLEAGLGVAGQIGHTQPRRIAARTVGQRVADELNTPLGQLVGVKMRFTDQTSPGTLVKLMTDGVLLAETQSDRRLQRYDCLIIDEAHERSLNIDFLLGYLKDLVSKRDDLRVVITSATIDPQRFAHHFRSRGKPAPVIEVSGRTYPVEVRYRAALADPDLREAIEPADLVVRTLEEIETEGPGDVLVFMPGEREIREASHALRKRWPEGTGVDVLPLYARLSPAEQQRVFKSGGGRGRRVVIATNVAETSVTVPGIRYVIDTGTARLSRYSPRTRIQGLEIEPISRASADQRKGRCGRVGPGVCYRLYAEADFLSREEFTTPEILRTNLASVILQMAALKLGRPDDFPFVERPDGRLIRDGYDTLRELNAIDDRSRLTDLGRRMARLPVDPRVARIVLAGADEGALEEAVVIAAALSVQDPRDRPIDKADAADHAHEQFRHPTSDFISLLRLWDFYHDQRQKLSKSKLAKACRQNFLSERRLREWWDVHRQLRLMARDLGLKPTRTPETGAEDPLHRALLAGLLANVGQKGDGYEYTGVRGAKFHIFPGSGVFEEKPKWLLAAEVVRTTRLYARTVGRIDPAWIEHVGAHLVKRSYTDPAFSAKRNRVEATERVTLGSLEVAAGKRVHFGPIEPVQSRELLIREGLVGGKLRTGSRTVRRNRQLAERVERLERKLRRIDLNAGDEAQYAFYDKRIPEGVWSGARFDRWLKDAEQQNPNALRMRQRDLLLRDVTDQEADYPDQIDVLGQPLEVAYTFDPDSESDGVALRIPLEMLSQIDPETCDKLLPGVLREKLAELLRTLPRDLRRNFDAPRLAAELTTKLAHDTRPVLTALADELSARTGTRIRPEQFRPSTLPKRLQTLFVAIDAEGRTIDQDRDLNALRDRLGAKVVNTFEAHFRQHPDPRLGRRGITHWDFEDLPRTVEVQHAGRTLKGFTAIIDEGTSVAIRVVETPDLADRLTLRGAARLFVPVLREDCKLEPRLIAGIDRLRVLHAPIGPSADLDNAVMLRIAERLFLPDAKPVRTYAEFTRRVDKGWARLGDVSREVVDLFARVLEQRSQLESRLSDPKLPERWGLATRDAARQLADLTRPEFLLDTPWQALQHYPRFLRAIERRLERLRSPGVGVDPVQRDKELQAEVNRWEAAFIERATAHAEQRIDDPALTEFRWLIEELRVSLFAQELGTVVKISPARMQKAWDKVR